MKIRIITLLVFLLTSIAVSGASAIDATEEQDYAFGSFLRYAENVLTILDYETDEPIENQFEVTKDTSISGVSQLAALKKDTWVDVDYVVRENKKVAIEINIDAESADLEE
ncbi:MAG: hypothetical protein ACI9CF_001001 [Candidatus Omnitrophota bacterium]|jgi:hypothetical protein